MVKNEDEEIDEILDEALVRNWGVGINPEKEVTPAAITKAKLQELITKARIEELERLTHPDLFAYESRAKHALADRIQQLKDQSKEGQS